MIELFIGFGLGAIIVPFIIWLLVKWFERKDRENEIH
jgi:hypothetical protein